MKFVRRLRALFRKEELNQHLSDELAFHLEKQIELNMVAGMSAAEARYAALRKFGGVEQVKEECRDAWGVRFIDTLLQDIRFGLRMLAKNPGFTAVAVLMLSIGIGMNTGIYSIIESVLYRPIPAYHPNELVAVYTTSEKGSAYDSSSYPDYLYYRDHSQTLSGLIAYARVALSWEDSSEPRLPWSELVSGNYFPVLGIRPSLGRLFSPVDDHPGSNARVVVLSYKFWKQYLGADRNVVGKTVSLNNRVFVIVGVAPEGFGGINLDWGEPPAFWLPMAAQEIAIPGAGDLLQMREGRWFLMVGRLNEGATFAQAQSELPLLAKQLAKSYPATNGESGAVVLHATEGRFWPAFRSEVKRFLRLFAIAVGLVLLIACSNVATLLLARGLARRKEMAVRAALGAGRGRVFRQLLVENLLLSLAGATVGLLVAAAIMNWVPHYKLPFHIPMALGLRLNVQVLGFTGGTVMAAVLLFGLLPSLRTARTDLREALSEAGGKFSAGATTLRLQKMMTGLQLALTTVTVITACLLLVNLRRLENVRPGFDPHNVLAVEIDLFSLRYSASRAFGFWTDVLNRVSALPGVQSATLTSELPLGLGRSTTRMEVAGGATARGETEGEIEFNSVGPAYFQTMGIRLLAGRDMEVADREGASTIAVINRTMAQRFWPGRHPIGQHFKLPELGRECEVVGVAEDVKVHTLWESPEPYFYLSALQNYAEMRLLVKTRGQPLAQAQPVRRIVAAIDRTVPLYDIETLDQQVSNSLSQPRMAAELVGVFGLFALILASVGVYGTVAYLVAGRSREIGIRMALGAQPRDVLWLALGQGLKIIIFGLGAGILAALAATRVFSSVLYGVSPTDPLIFCAVILFLLLVGVITCCIPALRATKVDPMVALRNE
jgi:predicted permease